MPRLGVRQVYVIGQAAAKYMHPVAMNVVDVVGFMFSGLIVTESDITSFVYQRHLYDDIGSHLLGFSLLNASGYTPWLLSHTGSTIITVEQLPGSVNFPFCYFCLFAFPDLRRLLSKSRQIRVKVLGDNLTDT